MQKENTIAIIDNTIYNGKRIKELPFKKTDGIGNGILKVFLNMIVSQHHAKNSATVSMKGNNCTPMLPADYEILTGDNVVFDGKMMALLVKYGYKKKATQLISYVMEFMLRTQFWNSRVLNCAQIFQYLTTQRAIIGLFYRNMIMRVIHISWSFGLPTPMNWHK